MRWRKTWTADCPSCHKRNPKSKKKTYKASEATTEKNKKNQCFGKKLKVSGNIQDHSQCFPKHHKHGRTTNFLQFLWKIAQTCKIPKNAPSRNNTITENSAYQGSAHTQRAFHSFSTSPKTPETLQTLLKSPKCPKKKENQFGDFPKNTGKGLYI